MVRILESSYGYWSSSRSFLLVAAGAAIGIGNLARLPYLMGHYGGAVFVGVYLAALVLLGLPLLIAEWLFGRWTRADPVSGFTQVGQSHHVRRSLRLLGWASLAAAVGLLSYYSVIAGWSLGFAFRGASGSLAGDPEAARESFLALAQDPERALAWHTLFMVTACMIVSHGVRDGIERAARYLVPAAMAAALALTAYAALHADVAATYRWLLEPRIADLGWKGIVEALQQAFFTLALGFGAMLTLGAYLPAGAPLVRLAIGVVLIDLVFNLLVGFVLVALALSAGLQPVAGVGMLFQVLPQALPEGLAAIWVPTSFYLMLFSVTMSAATTLLEPLTRFLMERMRLTRVFAATTGAIIVWYLGLGSLLSFSRISDLQVLGRNFFEWMQFLSTTLAAPLSALLLCTVVSRLMPLEQSRAAWGPGEAGAFRSWLWALRYPARLALCVVVTDALGLLDWLAELWS